MFHMRSFCLSVLVTLFVSGCTASYVPAPLPMTHPANPAAPEAPPPPPSHAFRNESILSLPAEEMPTQGSRAEHGAMQEMHGGH